MKMSTTGDSPYLAKENVPVPVVATIASVTFESITFRNVAEDKWVLHFASPKMKPMILNKGNRKTLIGAYGDDTDNYPGKKIEVWVNPNVEYEGEVVGGLRLRIPSQNGAVLTWAQAVTECAALGISKDELISYLKSKGSAGYKPDRDTATVKSLMATRAEQEQGFDALPEPPAGRDESEIPF